VVLAAVLDGTAFDLLSHVQNALAAPEVDVGRREVVEAFVISVMIVVIDEGGDGAFQIAGEIVVFKKDPALQ
jgi:hypothetical protein